MRRTSSSVRMMLRATCASGRAARPTFQARWFATRGSCAAASSSAARRPVFVRLTVPGASPLANRLSRHFRSSVAPKSATGLFKITPGRWMRGCSALYGLLPRAAKSFSYSVRASLTVRGRLSSIAWPGCRRASARAWSMACQKVKTCGGLAGSRSSATAMRLIHSAPPSATRTFHVPAPAFRR